MIYWGGGTSDAQWTDRARLHINAVEEAGINPEQIIFVSWDKYPARTLPETDSTTLSSLIGYYFEHYK
jgi:hypothetical protein